MHKTFPEDLLEQLNSLGFTPLTQGQIAALAGTSGTPSGTNKFVTDQDPRNTNARTPTAHGSSAHTGVIGSWAQIDKSTSNLGDITTKSHTSLTDVGTHSHNEIDGLFNGSSTITGLNIARTDGVVAAIDIKGVGDAYNFSGLRLHSDETVDKYWAFLHRKADILNSFMLEYFDGATLYSQIIQVTPTGLVGIGRSPAKNLDVLGYFRANGLFNLKNDAPADADLAAGECCWWYDKTDGAAKVMFKAKTNNGTVVTGSLPLS